MEGGNAARRNVPGRVSTVKFAGDSVLACRRLLKSSDAASNRLLSLSLSEGREDGHFNSYVGRSAPRCDAMRFAFQRQASETRDANDKVNRDDGCREIKRGSDVETVRRVGF